MENSRYGLLLFLIISLHLSIMGVTVQEKQVMYEQLADLENQRKLLRAEYEKATENELSDDARNMVEQRYTQKIKDISEQIEKQKRILEATTQQELLWSGAKIFGATALLGLLAYNLFVVARMPHKEQPIAPQIPQSILKPTQETKPIIPPVSLPTKIMGDARSENSKLETQQLSWQDSVVFDDQKDIQKIPHESPYVLPPQFQQPMQQPIDPKEVPITLQTTKMPLTPQEKALYELRYQNLRDASAFYFFVFAATQIAGPVTWPIDLILFGIPALSGVGAAYYKAKLQP